jgi:hypothetical protein
VTIKHVYKDPNKHCDHCNIDGYTKEKCQKFHLELSPKNHKQGSKKKTLIDVDAGKDMIESILDHVDEKIVYTTMKKEVNVSILHHNEEKEMVKFFHVNI